MATPAEELTEWFGYLNDLKECLIAIDNDASALSCSDFANAKITDWLTDKTEIGQFAACCTGKGVPGVDATLVGASSTFLNVLESAFDFPNMYIAAFIQTLAGPTYALDKMDTGDFILLKATAVYPAPAVPPAVVGTLNATWVATSKALAGIMGGCYSAAQQAKLAVLVVDATKMVDDLVNQIAVLG
jgi:hypothetical protein